MQNTWTLIVLKSILKSTIALKFGRSVDLPKWACWFQGNPISCARQDQLYERTQLKEILRKTSHSCVLWTNATLLEHATTIPTPTVIRWNSIFSLCAHPHAFLKHSLWRMLEQPFPQHRFAHGELSTSLNCSVPPLSPSPLYSLLSFTLPYFTPLRSLLILYTFGFSTLSCHRRGEKRDDREKRHEKTEIRHFSKVGRAVVLLLHSAKVL